VGEAGPNYTKQAKEYRANKEWGGRRILGDTKSVVQIVSGEVGGCWAEIIFVVQNIVHLSCK
jgi:hypothetical protein